jgi:hypothetical protein
MNIEKYDILTLDNNIKYVVATIIKHNDIDYYFLCEEKNPKISMFCYLRNNKLVRLEDKKLIELLSLKITKELFS